MLKSTSPTWSAGLVIDARNVRTASRAAVMRIRAASAVRVPATVSYMLPELSISSRKAIPRVPPAFGVKDVIVLPCQLAPSADSRTLKLSCLRPGTGLPSSSVTLAYTPTCLGEQEAGGIDLGHAHVDREAARSGERSERDGRAENPGERR